MPNIIFVNEQNLVLSTDTQKIELPLDCTNLLREAIQEVLRGKNTCNFTCEGTNLTGEVGRYDNTIFYLAFTTTCPQYLKNQTQKSTLTFHLFRNQLQELVDSMSKKPRGSQTPRQNNPNHTNLDSLIVDETNYHLILNGIVIPLEALEEMHVAYQTVNSSDLMAKLEYPQADFVILHSNLHGEIHLIVGGFVTLRFNPHKTINFIEVHIPLMMFEQILELIPRSGRRRTKH